MLGCILVKKYHCCRPIVYHKVLACFPLILNDEYIHISIAEIASSIVTYLVVVMDVDLPYCWKVGGCCGSASLDKKAFTFSWLISQVSLLLYVRVSCSSSSTSVPTKTLWHSSLDWQRCQLERLFLLPK